jgi:hypothetical protein
MKIEFRIAKKQIKWKWIRKAQEGDISAITFAMAACLVDENGEYMDFDAALAVLDDLDGEQMESAVETFKVSFKDWSVPQVSAAS